MTLPLTKTTLFVRRVPLDATNEEFSSFFSQFGPLRAAFLVTGKQKENQATTHRGFGFVHFADVQDMQKCLEMIATTPFRGKKSLKAEIALRKHLKEEEKVLKPTGKKEDPLKSHRLIVRNIPFGTNEKEIEKHFSAHGKVLQVTLPRVDGDEKKIRGFAFVQMSTRAEAAKAMQNINGTQFKKRTLAVDWSLSKDKYNKATENTENNTSDPTGNATLDSAESADEIPIVKEEKMIKPKKQESAAKVDEEPETDEIQRTVFVRNLPFDVQEKTIREVFSKFGNVKSIKVVKDKSTGFSSGSAFVLFSTASAAQAALSASQNQPSSSSSTKKDDHSSILIDADRLESLKDGIVLQGRALFVFPALDKNAAVKLEKQRANPDGDLTVRDKRHLYLVNEGLVRQGAPAFSHWTMEEVEVRKENVKNRLQELKKDLNLCVSDVRLSIRHLPTRVDEKQLRAVFISAIERAKDYCKNNLKPPLFDPKTTQLLLNRKPRIKQVKIVRVTEREISSANEAAPYSKRLKQESLRAGRSKGFAFIQFTEHVHALACVRWLTNWGAPEENWQEAGMTEPAPNKMTKVKWPIVEFSTEKMAIVKARNEREKSKLKQVKK